MRRETYTTNAASAWLYASVRRILIAASLAVLLSSACGVRVRPRPQQPNPNLLKVSGSVTYLERIALPRGSSIQIELREARPSDMPSMVIAARTIVTKGQQVPVLFELAYDDFRIVRSKKYEIAARISKDGKPLFVTDAPLPTLNGAPTVGLNLVLKRAPN